MSSCLSVVYPPVDEGHMATGPPHSIGGLPHQEDDQDETEEEEDGGYDDHP